MPSIAEINSEARDLCDANSTSYPDAILLRRTNQAYEQVVSWILQADGMWQWDDDNFTTNPVGTVTLISGQHEYTFTDKFLDILEIDILDLGGVFKRIEPFDAAEVGMSFEEYFGVDTGEPPNGFPEYYDKVGNSIYLDKNPTATNVTLAAGMKVKFKRTADIYISEQVTTGTKVPGFASPYHYILSYMMAIPYCVAYKKDRVAAYMAIVGDTYPKPTGMKRDLLKHYENREKDSKHRMSMRPVRNFR